MFNLKPIDLDPVDQGRIRDLNDKTASVQRMIQMFVESGERRLAELQGQGRTLFEELGAKYKLDLNHVAYQPSVDGKQLVPTTVMLTNGQPGKS